MGNTRLDHDAYAAYVSSPSPKTGTVRSAMTTADYAKNTVKPEFLPKNIAIRESRNSPLNPHATPIIVALDSSGSMGYVVETCRKAIGTLFTEVIKRAESHDSKMVTDPHVMAQTFDDVEVTSADEGVLQVTQFEADPVTIGTQIEDLVLIGRGGGNNHESYLAPLYFAVMKTECDAFNEGRKGYLFTVGDEQPQWYITKNQIAEVFGGEPTKDLTAEELVTMVQRDWNYFHIMVENGSHMRYSRKAVIEEWTKLLGQRAVLLSDESKLAEVITSLIEINEGADRSKVLASWDADSGTRAVVANATSSFVSTTVDAGPVAL